MRRARLCLSGKISRLFSLYRKQKLPSFWEGRFWKNKFVLLASEVCRGALGRGGRTGETGAVDAPILGVIHNQLRFGAISRDTACAASGACSGVNRTGAVGFICFVQKSLELLSGDINADISIVNGFEYHGSGHHLRKVSFDGGVLG